MQRLVSLVDRNHRRILAATVLLVLVLGLFYSYHTGNKLNYWDEREYEKLAQGLVSYGHYSKDGISPAAFRPPGYPFVLALFKLLGAKVWHLKVVNFLALAGCLYLLYRILDRHSSRFAAAAGVLLFFLYPVLLYTAGTLYPQTVGSFLFLLSLLLLTDPVNPLWKSIGGGLCFGFLILVIPSFVLTLIPLLIWMYMCKRRNRLSCVIAVCVVSALVVVPWTVRNYRIFHTLVFVSANSGEMLLYGNCENTTPNAGPNADISGYLSKIQGMNEVQQDAYMKTEAIKYIKAHKLDTLKMYCMKFINYFNWRNDLKTGSQGARAKDLLMLFTYGVLLLFTIVRLTMHKKIRINSLEWLLLVLYISNGFFTAIFFTRVRYRLPYDFLLIILAAVFLSSLLNVKSKKALSEPSS